MTPQDREACVRALQLASENPSLLQNDEHLKALIAKVHHAGRKHKTRPVREARRQLDRAQRDATLLAQQTRAHDGAHFPALPAPNVAQNPAPASGHAALVPLHAPVRCYICKQLYREMHAFYHLLCPPCAAMNWEKRAQRADLRERVALLTGGRIKIGYQLALKLLRDGARLHLTTRFPADAAQRFQREADASEWSSRLILHALDLRDVRRVEAFCAEFAREESHLDILINNAAQTVKRPREFYDHLLPEAPLEAATPTEKSLQMAARHVSSVLLETDARYPNAACDEILPHFDGDGQPLDARRDNSWRLRLHEVSTLELLETQLVNAVAPFLLSARLKPLLLRSPHARRFIVHASAMEGQFARARKTPFHPHTNMAKAALHMMTRTSAQDFARDGIYMNSADTGWITDENPHANAAFTRRWTPLTAPLGFTTRLRAV